MKKFLDLGLQPLANSYLDQKDLNKREKKFNLFSLSGRAQKYSDTLYNFL